MNSSHLKCTLALSLVALIGCEVPAASGTVEITIEDLSARDIDNQGRLLAAVAGLSGGACSEGPCSPNPCTGDPQGKTACLGMGDVHMCRCPAGTHEEMEMGGNCVPDEECGPQTCNNRGACEQMDTTLTCMCNEGFTGPNCGQCDADAGFFPDGLGGCSNDVEVCREGQGTEAFREIIAEAEEELGHAPSELELSSARIEVVPNSQETARSWDYLWDEEVTLFVQTVSGFPHNAGSAEIPPADTGFEPLEFDMVITRPVTSGDEQFLSGDFRVGISGPTERQLTEEFGVDVKIIMDFAAY